MAAADVAIVIDIHDALNMGWEVTRRTRTTGFRDIMYRTTFKAPGYVRDVKKIVVESNDQDSEHFNIEFNLRSTLDEGVCNDYLKRLFATHRNASINLVRVNNISKDSDMLIEICDALHLSLLDLSLELRSTVSEFATVPGESLLQIAYNKLPAIMLFRNCLISEPLVASVAADQSDAAPFAVAVRARSSSVSVSDSANPRTSSTLVLRG